MKSLFWGQRDDVLHTASFQYADRHLFFARARLYEDRLKLSGLQWTGRHTRTIPLEEVARVEWWSGVQKEPNFALHLHDGSRVTLWLKGAGLWKYKVAEHAPNLVPDEEPLPDAQQNMASAA